MYCSLPWYPHGTNSPLHYLRSPTLPQTPLQLPLTSLSICFFPAMSRQYQWLIGKAIDYDSCLCPLRYRPSVSATAGSSFVNIRVRAVVKRLCILSGWQLALYISDSVSALVMSPRSVSLGRWITVTTGSIRSINPECCLNHVECHKQE